MSDQLSRVAINFVLDKKDFAFRVWPTVPRVGEFVTLRPDGQPTTYEVRLVLWNVREEPDHFRGRLECDVHITQKKAALPAQAIEARQGGDAGSIHESAVGEADAPNTSQEQDNDE